MFYAKFVNDKFFSSTNALPEGGGFLEVADDSLLGQLLVKELDGTFRVQTEEEIEQGFQEFLQANKAANILSQQKAMLLASEDLIKNDVWDKYTQAQKDLVTAYRAKLKFIGDQKDFSKDIDWPTSPILN